MAQTGYTPLLIYASGTATNVPLAANLTSSASGAELALNYADGKLFYKNSSGVVTLLASAAGASGDVVGPGSATDNALARFDGTTGKLIQNSVGVLSDAGVLTGLTGLTSSGSITFSSLTATRVPYASTGGLLVDSANMTFNGTRLTVADLADSGLTSGRVTYAAAGGALTDSANLTFDGTNLTLGGGTANGVAYLNGSKVLTTGSALVFDGVSALSMTPSTNTQSIQLRLVNGAGTTYIGTDSSTGASFGSPYAGVFWQSGNYPWLWAISGSEQMRLTSTGLGIGTSSPGNKLDIVSAGSSQIRVKDGVVATAYYDFGRDGVDGFFGFSGAQTTFSGYKWSVNAGSEVMRITNGGNLGIGTSSPAYRLDVAGALRIENTSATHIRLTNSAAFPAILGQDGSSNFTITNGGATRVTLDASGNLGLGVTPSAWGSFTAIEGTSSGNFGIAAKIPYVVSNAFFNGSAWVYKTTASASHYYQNAGNHYWSTAPSGTAGNAISFTQAMTLTGSTPTVLTLKGSTSSNGGAALYVSRAASAATLCAFGDASAIIGGAPDSSTLLWSDNGIPLRFFVGGEVARFNSSGAFMVGVPTPVNSALLTVNNMGMSSYNGSNNNTINTIAVSGGSGGGMCVIAGVDFQSGASFSRLYLVAVRVSGGTASQTALIGSAGTGSASFSFAESGGFLTVTGSGFSGFGAAWTAMFINT